MCALATLRVLYASRHRPPKEVPATLTVQSICHYQRVRLHTNVQQLGTLAFFRIVNPPIPSDGIFPLSFRYPSHAAS